MLTRLSFSPAISPVVLRGLACIAVAAAVAWWGYQLVKPLPAPAAPPAVLANDDNAGAKAVADWLAPGPAKVDVKVTGIMLVGLKGAAVLSINGGPPKAYVVGDSLAQSVTLDRVEARKVILDQAGKSVTVSLPIRDDATAGLQRIPKN